MEASRDEDNNDFSRNPNSNYEQKKNKIFDTVEIQAATDEMHKMEKDFQRVLSIDKNISTQQKVFI